ncbi:hypothetical protein Tco_0553036 [Tanacetum coccineum]
MLLYQTTDTPYSINLNTPHRSVECQYAVLNSQNTSYYLKEQIRHLDYRIQYAVLGRRFDTSYPTGGYGVSGRIAWNDDDDVLDVLRLDSRFSARNIIDGVDIENITIEQYLELTQENHAPGAGIKVDDMIIAEYLEYENTIKTQDYDDYQPHSAKADVLTRYRGHLSPIYKSPDPPLDAKTNPYFQASLSPIHPKITKTLSKHTRENEVIKEREQSDQGLGDWFEAELEKCWKIQQKRDNSCLNLGRQAQDDALRNWEAQIDQLRRQEHEVSLARDKGRHGVSKDKDDLEGIIEYLEPTLYDGFIDHNDEAYKRRRNKLLGMPYTKPPPIVKEEAKITRYNMGAGEKEDICTKWALCNPHFDECDRGDNPRENKEYWESSNDDKRTDLEWENLSIDNWVKVAFGKGIKSLWEDEDNLKDFRQISNLKAMLREFLVLIPLFPFYLIFLMYNRDIVQIKWGDGSRINT